MDKRTDLMNALLSKDKAAASQMDKKILHSKRLSKITEVQDFEIEIRGLSYGEVKRLRNFATDKNGDMIHERDFETNIKTCVKGIVWPDLSNEDLQEQYGAANAENLCEILFDTEILNISQEILALSNLAVNPGDVEEIKN